MINLYGNTVSIDTTDGSEVQVIARTENGYTVIKIRKDKVVRVTEEGEAIVCE